MLKKALITEKTTKALKDNKYSFAVVPMASKEQIKKTVEKTYGVHVVNVWTKTGWGRKKREKKAVVQLKEGEKIEVFQTGD